MLADPPQPGQHVGDVRSEHAAVDVGFVDHHVAQAVQRLGPDAVRRQDPGVQHVGVGQDQVRPAPHLASLRLRRVAVVDRQPQVGRGERRQRSRLVLGEGLGRVQVHGARPGVLRDRVQHRQVERQRLAAGGAGDHHRVARPSCLCRIRLVGVQPFDAGGRQRGRQARIDPGRHVGEPRRPAGDGAAGDHLLAGRRSAEREHLVPGRGLADASHAARRGSTRGTPARRPPPASPGAQRIRGRSSGCPSTSA